MVETETIAGVSGEVLPPATADEGDTITADDVREMMDSVSFDDDDVKDMLEEAFEALANLFGSDHWKLTPRQTRMLTKPVTKLLNACWARLCQYLPDMIERLCLTTPGLAATITKAGIVVVPKGVKQWQMLRPGVHVEVPAK